MAAFCSSNTDTSRCCLRHVWHPFLFRVVMFVYDTFNVSAAPFAGYAATRGPRITARHWRTASREVRIVRIEVTKTPAQGCFAGATTFVLRWKRFYAAVCMITLWLVV